MRPLPPSPPTPTTPSSCLTACMHPCHCCRCLLHTGPLVVTQPLPPGVNSNLVSTVDSSDEDLDDTRPATPAGGGTGRSSAWRYVPPAESSSGVEPQRRVELWSRAAKRTQTQPTTTACTFPHRSSPGAAQLGRRQRSAYAGRGAQPCLCVEAESAAGRPAANRFLPVSLPCGTLRFLLLLPSAAHPPAPECLAQKRLWYCVGSKPHWI